MAGNGGEGLDIFARDGYDLVLMDIQMPVMGGFEATREIRKMEQGTGKRTPVIALTAHAIKGYDELCREAGMDAYLSKPIKPKELFSVLGKFSSTP